MTGRDQNKRGYNAQEAMRYLGVKRKAFDKFYRPYLSPMKFGTSIIFDVIDLDSVMDDYKRGNERLISKIDGVSIKSTVANDFESALKSLKKQKIG
jgi:hypothetical protein